jgi:hypothetical protein
MGFLLLVVGLAALGFGLWNHLKGKRILAAPFQKTGEIAKNPVSPDPKGAMSTEGKVLAPAVELLSPCTKQPCLSYEVKIERLYEKTETTQDGTKTVKGTETLETLKGGAVFGLDDGSGVVLVDVSKGADFDNYKDGLKKELNGHGGSSRLQFGDLSWDVPVLDSDKGWTTGFKATEKYVPVEGSLFVLGKLEGATLSKPGWRSMMTSARGREGLLGSIQKKKKFSFAGGGVMAVLSIPAFIFAPEPDPNAVSAYCETTLTDARQKCSANVSDLEGDTYTWNVTRPGRYELTAFAPKKKISFMPQLIVKDAAGNEVGNFLGGVGVSAKGTVEVKPGAYSLVVLPGDNYMVKGGFSYDLAITSLTKDAAPAVAEAAPAGAYSSEQLASRVAELNELCPDTFCEGQFNYTFKKLECADATHCLLSFTAKDQDKPAAKPYDAQVKVEGFTALVRDPEAEFVYEGSFDERVSMALMKWEEHPKSVASVIAPKPAPAPKKVAVAKPAPQPMAAKPAPRPVTAPVAKPAPAVARPAPAPAPVKKAAPAAPSVTRSSKNMED